MQNAAFGDLNIRVEKVGWDGLKTIVFVGKREGDEHDVMLWQHLSQLSLLVASEPLIQGEEPREIVQLREPGEVTGFRTVQSFFPPR